MNKIEKAIAYFEDAVRESDEIIEDCSPALQAELIEQKQHFITGLAGLREKAERENLKPLILHFGEGKIGVGTCRPEESETWNELLLWNPRMQQAVGNHIPIAEGTTTDDLEVYARLFFHNAESAQVVVDALSKIIDSYGQNNTHTNADRIRSMSDEELAKIIVTECLDEKIHFCQNRPECIDLLDTDEEITDEMCIQCVLDWLRQPAEGETP